MLSKGLRNDGFTLLEVVISLGLIAIALLAVFRLQAQNLDLQSEASFITIGNQLLQDRLARLQAGKTLVEDMGSGDCKGYPGFQCREEIREVPDMDGLYKVHVSVFIEDGEKIRNMSLETYIFRPGE